jgi:apolipoprotein N-acyltransferase
MLHRHAPDVVSLVFGTLFAGFTVIWLLSATDVIDYQEAWLAGPAILIVAGVLGLLVALRPSEPVPVPGPAPWAFAPGARGTGGTGGPVGSGGTGAATPTETEPTTGLTDSAPETESKPGRPAD